VKSAFADLGACFGILALDDDELRVGSSTTWP
jgi:hypothetical protein